MKRWIRTARSGLLVSVAALAAFAVSASAARLTTSGTTPRFEASVSGDTCGNGTALELDSMTVRRKYAGPVAGEDSLVNVPPNTGFILNAAVPTGLYTVTVDLRDKAGNWSCPVSLTKFVRGKPSRVESLGVNYTEAEALAYLRAIWFRHQGG